MSNIDKTKLPSPGAVTASSVRWRIVGLLMAISFLNHFNRISMSVAGKELIRGQVFNDEQMGLVYSTLLYAYTLCMTPGGWFSDVAGGRVALSVVGFGAGCCAFLTGLCLGGWVGGIGLLTSLLIVRGLMGACISPIYPGSGAIVSRWLPFRQRALAMALITGAAPLGIASTFVVFPWMLQKLGISPAFFALGAVTVGLALLWVWYSRSSPQEHSGTNSAEREHIAALDPATAAALTADRRAGGMAKDNDRGIRQPGTWIGLLKNRSLWLITLSYGALGYMEYLQFYWSDYYFSDVLKFEGVQAQWAAVAPPLLMCVAMPVGGWLSDRLLPVLGYRGSRATVACLGMVGSAAALAIATFLANPVAIVAGFAITLGLIGLSEGPCWATAIDLGRQRGGTSAGIFNTGGNGFGALAPIVTPWFKRILVEQHHMEVIPAWNWSIRLGCLICLAGALLWLWIDPAEQS